MVQYLINYRFYFASCIFNKYPISVPGYNPGHHISFSCYVFLVTSSLQQFPSLSLFPTTLAVFKSACQIFCRMSFNWVCLLFSHDQTRVKSLEEEQHGTISGNTWNQYDLIVVIFVKGVSARFFHCQVTLFLFLKVSF